MARTAESSINALLAEALRRKHPAWQDGVAAEQSGVFENRALRPDIIVRNPSGTTVVVETKFAPGPTLEDSAMSRLGLRLATTGQIVEQAIAVRIPDSLRRSQANLLEQIELTTFEYAAFTETRSERVRWPKSGWVSGGINELAYCIEHASLSEHLLEESLTVLERGIERSAQLLVDFPECQLPHYMDELGRVLHQAPGEQTVRMAMSILANAMLFHARIQELHDIPSLQQLRSTHADRSISRSDLGRVWSTILSNINFWPIFSIALQILEALPSNLVADIIDRLGELAEHLVSLGATSYHDLSGRLFQSLIVDRKFLATFYTLPTSATLLAELGFAAMEIHRLEPTAFGNITVADFSCGTGALLSAAYQGILSRYRRHGLDDRELHQSLMENGIIAADIMPAATHLTASLLSSAHPDVTFKNTKVYTMPYGHLPSSVGGSRTIGSLDLIEDRNFSAIFSVGQKQLLPDSQPVETRRADIPHGSVDLVIMNPPFTRPTNHEATEVPIPSFAGFEKSDLEQRAMSDRLKELRRGLDQPAGNGNAGLASNFIDLADQKVKTGGAIAMVLPFAAVSGKAWQGARSLLARQYRDISVVSIANSGSNTRSFSADTAMAECLIVARKAASGTQSSSVRYINLYQRPSTIIEAVELARCAGKTCKDSPISRIRIGDQEVGNVVQASISDGGAAGVKTPELAEVMLNLQAHRLALPQMRKAANLPICELGQLGERGLVHRDIGQTVTAGTPGRGPFTIAPISDLPSYPVLWGHDAEKETCLTVSPDSQGEVIAGRRDRVSDVWQTATRFHFNLGFRLNSQSLAACVTPEPALGGPAWPNFSFRFQNWEDFMLLWANSTLGLMSCWWSGTRQQQGRAILTVSTLPLLKVCDPRKLSESQLRRASDLAEQFMHREFLPAHEAYKDPVRQDLDAAVFGGVLGMPDEMLAALSRVRYQWCSEPSVGSKAAPARPETSNGPPID